MTDCLLSSIVRACTNCSLLVVEKAQSRPKSAGTNGPCPKDRRVSGMLPSALTCRAGFSIRCSRVARAGRAFPAPSCLGHWPCTDGTEPSKERTLLESQVEVSTIYNSASNSDRLGAAGMRAHACRARAMAGQHTHQPGGDCKCSAVSGPRHFEFQRDSPACQSGPGGSRA